MWMAVVIIFFLGADGSLQEQEFRSRETFQTSTECLQGAGRAVIQAVPEDDRVRGYAVACQRVPTV